MFISEAYAQAAPSPAPSPAIDSMQAGTGAALMQFLPLIIIFVIFYVLLIRPQQRRAKAHEATLDNLKKGDRIVTGGGIFGTISKIEGVEAIVEIADGVKVRVQKSSIGTVLNATPVATGPTAVGVVPANDAK